MHSPKKWLATTQGHHGNASHSCYKVFQYSIPFCNKYPCIYSCIFYVSCFPEQTYLNQNFFTLTFTCTFICGFFAFNKIFAATGSLKSDSPSCQNAGNNNFPNGARQRRPAEPRLSAAGGFEASTQVSACLQPLGEITKSTMVLDLFQGLL